MEQCPKCKHNFSREDEKIDAIIENFNFKKVHEAMIALDWKWLKDENTMKTPTIKLMKDNAERLLRLLIGNEETTQISSGGFTAEKVDQDYILRFCIDEINSNEVIL